MIAEGFDTFLFDLDGAVYVGEEPTPGAVETLERLRERGAAVRFLTNNPRATRRQVADRLAEMGVEAAVEEIATAGWVAAKYAAEQGAETAAMVGSEGLAAELRAVGLRLVESDPDVVVVGAADDTDYGDIRRAARLIRAGAPFVATNPDASYPTPDGPAPGTGAIVRAVEVASGVRPTIVGKPDPRMFEIALEELPDSDAVVVGDNPETDVLGAHRAGLPAVLVGDGTPPGVGDGTLPGVADETPSGVAEADFRTPDATVADLRGLFDPGVTVRRWERPGYDWPEAVAPAVAAVVRDDAGRVLLVPGEDGWTLPMGDLERTETVAGAVRRTVRERTGMDAPVAGLVGVYSDPAEGVVTRTDGEVVQRVTTCLGCEVEGDIELAGDAAFIEPEAFPESLDPFAESVIEDVLSENGPVVR